MDQYLVISKHTADDCQLAVDHFSRLHAGFLTHYKWGCADGDHTAYRIIEADSREEALNTVPPLFRKDARAVRLISFDPHRKEDMLH